MRNGVGAIALVAAAAGGANPAKVARPVDPASVARTLDCASHRFKASIHLTGPDGKPQERTVRMCGTKGQSDAEWIATLQDAVTKTQVSAQMPEAAKEQIVAAVNAEIERLKLPELNLPQGADISKLPGSTTRQASEAPLSRDYNALPPLPTASEVPAPHVLGTAAAAATPHLSLRCALVGEEDRDGPCDTIDKDTILVLRADEAYPKGVDVHLVRHGSQRAEIALPAMAAGSTSKVRVPLAVCNGIVRSTIEIQAVGNDAPAGTVPGTIGEYDLRC